MNWQIVKHKDKPYIKDDGGRFKEFNIKPLEKNMINDCAIRAIAIALDQSYRRTRDDLFQIAMDICDMPNSPKVYEPYLESKGWIKNKPPRRINNRKVEVRNLHIDRAIIRTSKHLTAMINGTVLDTWDCTPWCANSYYTPKETA